MWNKFTEIWWKLNIFSKEIVEDWIFKLSSWNDEKVDNVMSLNSKDHWKIK